jgi:hypothetical protein
MNISGLKQLLTHAQNQPHDHYRNSIQEAIDHQTTMLNNSKEAELWEDDEDILSEYRNDVELHLVAIEALEQMKPEEPCETDIGEEDEPCRYCGEFLAAGFKKRSYEYCPYCGRNLYCFVKGESK